jgi:hypothetical protein
VTGGIIPSCATCNDLGKDPNGCPKCNAPGPVMRATRASSAGNKGTPAKNDDVARSKRKNPTGSKRNKPGQKKPGGK